MGRVFPGWSDVKADDSQGLILDPLLFLIYISTIYQKDYKC